MITLSKKMLASFVILTTIMGSAFLHGCKRSSTQSRDDFEVLQGRWEYTYESGRKLPIVVTGDKLLIEQPDGKNSVFGRFILDQKANPRQFRLLELGDPSGENSEEWVGIYLLNGDVLRVAFSEEASKRPAAFTDDNTWVLVRIK